MLKAFGKYIILIAWVWILIGSFVFLYLLNREDKLAENSSPESSSNESAATSSASSTDSGSSFISFLGEPDAEAIFKPPYPIRWTHRWSEILGGNKQGEYITEFSVTGITVGEKKIESRPPTGRKVGDVVYALSLKVRVSSSIISSKGEHCVPVSLKMVLDEEGNTARPLYSAIYKTDGECALGSDEDLTGDIDFIVPKTEKEFTFLAGKDGEIPFLITILSGGKIEVKKFAQEG